MATWDLPWESVQVLAWIDHNNPGFGREVLGRLSLVELRGATVSHYFTGEPPAPEQDRRARRNRITDAWRWFLDQATAPVTLAAEDDTLPDADAYPRLLRHLEAGAVGAQGTEVARQYPYVPHWTVDADSIESGSYDGRPVVPIQGGGWYCSAMVTEAARGCLVAGEDLPLGPDVAFWRELARRGPCVGDWSIECAHFGPDFFLHPALAELRQVRFRRNGSRWERSECGAQPYRQACQRSEEGLLRVRVLKTFTGTPEEREKYANDGRKIGVGTIMEMTEARYHDLGVRPNPLVVALSPVDLKRGASLAGWAPPMTKRLETGRTEMAPDFFPANVTVEAPSEPSPEPADEEWKCEPCDRTFSSEMALKAHQRSRAHQG